jgi:hypothetical protein
MPGLTRGTHEKHDHQRRGRTAAARRWRIGEQCRRRREREIERERERERERESVRRGEKVDLRSNCAVIRERWINLEVKKYSRKHARFSSNCLL